MPEGISQNHCHQAESAEDIGDQSKGISSEAQEARSEPSFDFLVESFFPGLVPCEDETHQSEDQSNPEKGSGGIAQSGKSALRINGPWYQQH